jgi:hypothetical protein
MTDTIIAQTAPVLVVIDTAKASCLSRSRHSGLFLFRGALDGGCSPRASTFKRARRR